MKILLCLLLSLIFASASAQLMTDLYSFDFVVQQRIYDKPFSSLLTNMHKRIEPLDVPVSVGFQFTGKFHYPITRSSLMHVSGVNNYLFMLPTRVKLGDTMDAKITGFNFGLPVLGIDLLGKNKSADILLFAGMNTGCTWIYGSGRIHSKNAYFSPKAVVMPRFAIKNLVLSCFAEYDYDVSATRWKKTVFGPRHGLAVNPFKQGGLVFGLAIGMKES
jgi:hypothetical protein